MEEKIMELQTLWERSLLEITVSKTAGIEGTKSHDCVFTTLSNIFKTTVAVWYKSNNLSDGILENANRRSTIKARLIISMS